MARWGLLVAFCFTASTYLCVDVCASEEDGLNEFPGSRYGTGPVCVYVCFGS